VLEYIDKWKLILLLLVQIRLFPCSFTYKLENAKVINVIVLSPWATSRSK